ncbi:MAG: hypothetical protein AAF449_15030, partial [Myxococcota bacterium]
EDGLYGVKNDGSSSTHASSDKIWVEANAEAPLSSKPTGNKLEKDGKTYYEFNQDGDFYQDCIHCAEEIMHGDELPYGEADQSRVKGQEELVFGTGEEDDRQAIRDWAQQNPTLTNKNATPEVGEAYAIMPEGERSGGAYPYHAAAVVATDGSTTITLETSAGTEDAQTRDATLQYHIYSTDPNSGNTFHDVWGEEFGPNHTTVVIEPIPESP